MNYEKGTLLAYRNHSIAKRYKEQYTKAFTWARFTMWRQRLCVKKALKQCDLGKNSKILDIPCGTGTLASILNKFPFGIVAADISLEMMDLAREEYWGENFEEFVQADITNTPFEPASFDCVITIGFMHRVPKGIKEQTLAEIVSLSKKFIIISYSMDSPIQRLKKWLLKKVRPEHKSAPAPMSLKDILGEFSLRDLIIKRRFQIAYPFCADIVFLLEKKDTVQQWR